MADVYVHGYVVGGILCCFGRGAPTNVPQHNRTEQPWYKPCIWVACPAKAVTVPH